VLTGEFKRVYKKKKKGELFLKEETYFPTILTYQSPALGIFKFYQSIRQHQLGLPT
jgi:hypothetical protein